MEFAKIALKKIKRGGYLAKYKQLWVRAPAVNVDLWVRIWTFGFLTGLMSLYVEWDKPAGKKTTSLLRKS